MKQALAEMLDTTRLENTTQDIVKRFVYHLKFDRGKDRHSASAIDCYLSFATVIKEILLDNWLQTQASEYALKRKRVYYISLEFLIGRSLSNAILNLDIGQQAKKALQAIGYDLSALNNIEWDAGLGNGGLGRLAACYLDAMASLKIPVYGYGIRYEYGIFFQHIKACEQIETPDNWLRYGSVWEVPYPQRMYPVLFGGHVEQSLRSDGSPSRKWVSGEAVMAMAYDYLIPGYKNNYVNTLRLFSAKSTRDFNLSYFNEGEYVQAVADKNNSEIISKVLYPKDNSEQGKELRLKQEYFCVSATLSDILRRFLKKTDDFRRLPDFAAIQMNDTHPALTVAELMRVLVDNKALPWETAWEITKKTCNYTNHTILPEALEKWTVDLMHKVLPRHLEIIYEINQRFLATLSLDSDTIRRMSIIEEEPVKSVRMANLAIVGSTRVNGVSELHTQILKERVFKDFYDLEPEKFLAITNGITPRRWLMMCNPRLSTLIDKAIGKAWRKDLLKLSKLRPLQKDQAFLEDLAEVKLKNKQDFALYCHRDLQIKLDPQSIFDFQAKRLHEYKRQLLNALHIIHLIFEIREGKTVHPHSFFFAGKAAPGYHVAKLIISFICHLGLYIQRDPELSAVLNLNFLPNYSVTLAQEIMPAAEVSQQISLAGTEASGTGNMKFSLNGALTVGTLDGANIEIREAAGAENFFLFGMKADEVKQLKAEGYHPYNLAQADPRLSRIMDFIYSGELTPVTPKLFQPLVNILVHSIDEYCLIKDLPDYIRVMKDVDLTYCKPLLWNQMSLANISGMGPFSADEAVKNYARKVWHLKGI
ncbi:MAG: glycogen/starch/alpha-glucan phosphorylase [Candidatus Cloacimonetes bacterium]|jgi:starch phosphorylase|nr:glycogen/starch/alpha-glucan phosphorylase [Candidatus Cloacimonadota bacterium]MCK9184316.1 glycogen/starch/alpha-glucan phosphorylase [Candidatus Cloacimonadota bacterium]MCK9584263.1 glycogen/starch/alpha-glucan phosphorylase [Candidatus Cloacimonadota bacterium]